MDFNEIDKELYYELADCYLKKIDYNDLDIHFDEIISKSISILIDHDFIPVPCVEIKLELQKNQIIVGNYFLYIDESKQFLDEFLF